MIKRAKLIQPTSYIVVVLLLFSIPLFVNNTYYLHILIMVAINVILASSLRTIATTGQISLAHVGFMAVGSYTSALLVMKLGLSFWIALPIAGVAAGVLALMLGFPFTRVRRVYFAMLTLFASEVIRLIIVNWKGLTGGSTGIWDIPRPDPIVIPGLVNIVFDSKVPYYYLALIIMLITLLFLYRIDRSRIGAIFNAIEEGESVAESVGINTSRYKVLALCIGCFFAGIAGSFYAHFSQVISPSSYVITQAIYILVYMTIGGRRNFSGPAIGAFVLTFIPEIFRLFKEYQPLIFALLLLVIIFYLPKGLTSLPEIIKSQMSKSSRIKVINA